MKRLLPVLWVVFMHASLSAQWMQTHRPQFGISAGFGGLHEWGKPSFDLHWYRTTLHVAPGLYYFSTGVTQKLAWFNPKERKDRVIIFSFYYLNDYLLSRIKNMDPRRDLSIGMFMPGIHMNLNHLGTWYFQVSGGYMYAREKNFTPDRSVVSIQHHHLPMIEARLGGIFINRKEHHQEFPAVKPEVHKIKSRKLQFKAPKKKKQRKSGQ